jgi:cyclic pyranopterin phosphate synthase
MSKIAPHFTAPRTILADVVPLPMPYSIQVEVSQLCNLKCNYCMHGLLDQGKKKRKVMAWDTFNKMCDRIEEFGGKLKTVNFAGWGEPLINPHIDAMIIELKRRNITENIAIITNGIYLSPSLSIPLVEAGVDHIRISMQGMSGRKYREITGSAIVFEVFVDNIRTLYENRRRCKVYVKIADTALDEGDEEKFYKTFDGICDSMYVEKIRPMFQENAQDGKLISKYGDEHEPVICCPQPFFMMSVEADGTIMPCCNYYDPAEFGNIWDTSLKREWESRWMRQFRTKLFNRKSQRIFPICRSCPMPDAIFTPGDELDYKKKEILERL